MRTIDVWTWILAVTGMVAVFSLPMFLALALVGR